MKNKNLALSIIDYYNSEDFKGYYIEHLHELFYANKEDVLQRIQFIVEHDYFFARDWGFNAYLSDEKVNEIFEYIDENFEDFISDFYTAYVGPTSLSSICFGEQCEDLSNFNEDLKVLKENFENENFVVHDNYAYYDLSYSGLKVDLRTGDLSEVLKEYLK
jgi:hypothetical protein